MLSLRGLNLEKTVKKFLFADIFGDSLAFGTSLSATLGERFKAAKSLVEKRVAKNGSIERFPEARTSIL